LRDNAFEERSLKSQSMFYFLSTYSKSLSWI